MHSRGWFYAFLRCATGCASTGPPMFRVPVLTVMPPSQRTSATVTFHLQGTLLPIERCSQATPPAGDAYFQALPPPAAPPPYTLAIACICTHDIPSSSPREPCSGRRLSGCPAPLPAPFPGPRTPGFQAPPTPDLPAGHVVDLAVFLPSSDFHAWWTWSFSSEMSWHARPLP